jgi:nucleolar pre-ribosomal-associated protein 2
MVSQFGIEKLLSSIMSISSIGSKDLPRAYGPSIYRRLCQTTNTLIALHRKHLGGRFHVLVPLLQALLTCLFVPHSRVKSLGSKSTPPWLSQQSGVLDAEHAIAYTRILGSLTQPTVSSTASHPRPSINPMLIDETRKARQYAAQFVPYILLHFCSMQLVGKMNTEVRGGLMPGIWACIEAVPREALRGMNSGMGRDEREIWSALWAEWVRTGGKEH